MWVLDSILQTLCGLLYGLSTWPQEEKWPGVVHHGEEEASVCAEGLPL